ncbi:RNase H domain-containing protein [Trichonephila clavipes]|nr:RNase H domain-containing protein [Trichonephila clavipes]
MNKCPDLVVCLKRDLQCLRPQASWVLIYQLNVTGMKGRVDLAQQFYCPLLDFAQGAGIGVFSHLFSFYLHAGPLTTHFDGEVEAIHVALQQLAVRLPPIERAVILSDSTSALQALSNYNENNCLRVQNCRELLGKIKGKIVFQWVPSHCGLWGNERADFLAKK